MRNLKWCYKFAIIKWMVYTDVLRIMHHPVMTGLHMCHKFYSAFLGKYKIMEKGDKT